MTKKILITGAAGFIGFHLARHLHERGDQVLCLDNFNTYYDPSLKILRKNELEKSGITIIHGDINDEQLLESLVIQHQISHIAHLAAQAGVRYSLENPKTYIDSNIHGFLNILETCRRHPHIPLTYASSSSVYGLNTQFPFSIDNKTDKQASLYGVTKKTNELMAHSYHHLFGVKATGLRFFTVYGPYGRPDMAYFKFAEAINNNQPIDIYNHGKMERDFTYIDDIIQGTIAAIDLESPCELFNLGNNRPASLDHFISLIELALNKKAIRNLLPMQPGDVQTTFADISHSQRLLNFNPTTPLEKGIPLFISWFKNYTNDTSPK